MKLDIYRRHARALLRIGVPLMGSNLAQMAMAATDTLMLGRYDLAALAALTVAGTVYFNIFIFGSGLGMAVAPLVAEAETRGDQVTTRRVMRMALWLSMAFGALTLPIMWHSGWVLRMLGQEPEVARLGQDYLRIMGFSILPALGVMVMKNFLSGLERTGIILISTLGLALLNIPLNWILIFGHFGAPELGVQGAAISSLLLTSLNFVIMAAYAQWTMPERGLFGRIWAADWGIAGRVMRVGLPVGVSSVAEGGMFAASSIMMGWLGTAALAAHGVALQLSAITFMTHLGLSQALTVRAGQALGRRDEPMLRQVTLTAMGLSLGLVGLTVIVFLGAPHALMAPFLDPDAADLPQVLALGAALLAMAALFQLVDAGQVAMMSALRGVQDTAVPSLLATLSYWIIGIPAGYLCAFPLGLGAVGLWAGLCIGLGAATITLGLRFWLRSVHISRLPAQSGAQG